MRDSAFSIREQQKPGSHSDQQSIWNNTFICISHIKPLSSFFIQADWFVFYLLENTKDKFSRNEPSLILGEISEVPSRVSD